jgi:hypothetical protein
MVLAWAIWRLRTGFRLRGVHAAMLAYVLAAAASMLAHHRGGAKVLGIAELCALAVVTADLAPALKKPIALTIAITTLAAVAAAIAGLLLHYAGIDTALVGTYGDLSPGAYARVEAAFWHPNGFASWLVFASAVCAQPDALDRRLRRVVRIAFAVGVVLTFSRSILAYGLAVLIRCVRSRGLVAAAAIVAAGIVVVLTFTHLSISPLHPLATHTLAGESPRQQAIESSLRTVREHPLTGVGPDAHPAIVNQDGAIGPLDTHFTPLNIAATLGLPALAAFTAIIILLCRNRPRDRALWSAMAGMALDALASDIEDFRHLWVLFGLCDQRSADSTSPASSDSPVPPM